MAKILDMPKLSPTMEEGVLALWHKKEGDSVDVDDLLAEVETDKATMEFRAFDRGTLLKILVGPGTEVKLGQPVAVLGAPGEDISALVSSASAQTATAPAPQAVAEERPAPAAAPIPQGTRAEVAGPVAPAGSPLDRTERAAEPSTEVEPGRVLASPHVRRLARERGIDLSQARGSGDHGRVLPRDLEKAAEAPATSRALAPTSSLAAMALAAPEARPLSPMRKTIARRLTESKQTVPHFYLTIDVDAAELSDLRVRINEELAKSGPSGDGDAPPKVSLNDLLLKACAIALVRVPECNAQFTPEAILLHQRVDVSVAVAVPDGLVTPVVRNAASKSVVAIAKEVRDLASRARAKKLKPEEMQDGTFSISNLGMFGIDSFSAVINPPEGAILAVGQVRETPVVKDGALAIGKRLSMTLSCDHRVVDGAVGAAFLAELRSLLEHPMRILTG